MQLPFIEATPARPIAVSLGRSQRHLAVHTLAARRRTSGGGAVLMGPWLLRAMLVVPRSHPLLQRGPAQAAHWFGEVHQQWLAGLGIAAQIYRGPLVDHWACFAGRAPGELVVDDRKITGISQTWRRRRALLWSGTLVTPVPWELLTDALRKPPHSARELRAATVDAQEILCDVPRAAQWGVSLRNSLEAALANDAAR